jgi:hypothetical protein
MRLQCSCDALAMCLWCACSALGCNASWYYCCTSTILLPWLTILTMPAKTNPDWMQLEWCSGSIVTSSTQKPKKRTSTCRRYNIWSYYLTTKARYYTWRQNSCIIVHTPCSPHTPTWRLLYIAKKKGTVSWEDIKKATKNNFDQVLNFEKLAHTTEGL